MRSVNKVIIVGNVTRDPQVKSSQNGKTIATFGVATNRNWTTGDGDKRSSTEFHECVAWSRLAEICEKLIRKSMPVYIEGRLKTRSWENEDGTRSHKTEIVVTDLIILEKGRRNNDNSQSENMVVENNQDAVDASTETIEETVIVDEGNDEIIIEDDSPVSSPEPSSVNIEDDLGL